MIKLNLKFEYRKGDRMKSNIWVEPDENTTKKYNVELSRYHVSVTCLNCGHTHGANPRRDGKLLEEDLICNHCDYNKTSAKQLM